MKKVLFVATVTNHINAFHIPYLKLFKENGYEVHVASRGKEAIQYCDKHYNIPFERFPFKINNIRAYKELKRIINNNNYEVIHCHTPVGGVVSRLAARTARKKGTRVIYTAHGFHFYKGGSIFSWILYYPIEKICSKWTDTLITINNEDFKLAKKKFKKCKDIKLVHGVGFNPVRLEKKLSEEEKENKRRELGISKKDIVFSYVAELNKNKNQILLLKTIDKLKNQIPNVKLLLVGNGISYKKYQKMIIKNDLKNNVKLLGRRSDINELLSITDIYLASSTREGLGLNILEAIYKELPIIATNNRGHRELIKHKENGFLINNNYRELINSIKEMIELKGSFKTNNETNETIIKKYRIETIEKEMRKIYGL